MEFTNQLKTVTHSTLPKRQYACNTAWEAGNDQATLGSMAILRGHHHISWANACRNTFRRPAEPPNNKRDKPIRYKTPFDMSVSLITQSWYLFEEIWEARNNILHSSTGYAADAEKEQHFGTLLHYKRNAHSMLHYGDRHHISYPVQEIASWDRKRKKKTVAQLNRLHRQYKQECQLQAEGQKKLTAYDFYIIENEMVGD